MRANSVDEQDQGPSVQLSLPAEHGGAEKMMTVNAPMKEPRL
ncbi:hypothetical protein AERO8C_150109 [Aeromonas veronii]|uniref:Uncharacterized protein n=1 Tax=Aeromonas veronii TaxID=654 RepID=A0A653KVQ2_AERVE|nr:hypothetical protein AERO8C_150109 [Aeromonas veronii]